MITVKRKYVEESVIVEMSRLDLALILGMLNANVVDHDAISLYAELRKAATTAGFFPT